MSERFLYFFLIYLDPSFVHGIGVGLSYPSHDSAYFVAFSLVLGWIFRKILDRQFWCLYSNLDLYLNADK